MNWSKLKTVRIGGAWWIEGDDEYGLYGPYDNKRDADEDRIGITKSMRKINDSEYWEGTL